MSLPAFLSGGLHNALGTIAGRGTAAKHGDKDLAAKAQDATDRLSILGVDRNHIEGAVDQYAKGKKSYPGAYASLSNARPNFISAAINSPSAAIQAAQDGRPDEAAAQADVMGLKNLKNPLTAIGSLGLAGAGGYGYNRIGTNIDIHNAIRGTYPKGKEKSEGNGNGKDKKPSGPKDPLMARLADHGEHIKINGREGTEPQLLLREKRDQLRSKYKGGAPTITSELWRDAKANGVGGISKTLRKAKSKLWDKKKILLHGKSQKAQGTQPFVSRRDVMTSLKGNGMGMLRKGVLPAAALSGLALPFLREWMLPGGYRSGKKPYDELLDARRKLEQQKQ